MIWPGVKAGGEKILFMSMKQKVKGQVSLSNLQKYVIAFLVIGVAGTVGLSIVSSVQGNMYNSLSVDGETFNSTNDPYTYTVNEASDSNFYELTSVTVYDSESETSELSATITDASTGTIEVSGSNSDGDLEVVNYQYEDEDTEARNGADQALTGLNELLGFLPVIGLVVAAAVVISLVSGFGGRGGRRGRA